MIKVLILIAFQVITSIQQSIYESAISKKDILVYSNAFELISYLEK